jgi:hypothetical protein
VKLFVNADAETLGVLAVVELLLVEPELDDELPLVELDDELPHAAIPMLAVAASTVMTPLPFSRCTITLL